MWPLPGPRGGAFGMDVLGSGHTGLSGDQGGPWSPSLSGEELRTGSQPASCEGASCWEEEVDTRGCGLAPGTHLLI